MKLNFSVIPVNADNKKPLIKWQEYQTRKADEAQIRQWWEKWPSANIGIVTGAISGIAVIDIDEEIGYGEFESRIPDSLIMPTATTPSGGKHYYFKYPGEPVTSKARFLPGVDSRGDGGYITAPPSVRKEGKYEWLEGLSITGVALPVLPKTILKALYQQMSTPVRACQQDTNSCQQPMFQNGRRDEDLFHTAHLLTKAGAHDWEISQIISKLAESCGFPPEEAATKVLSALERADKKEHNMQAEIRGFVEGATGTFTLLDIYNTLNLKERKEKQNTCQIMHRLCKEGLTEKTGNKNGCFRKVNKSIIRMDIKNTSRDEYPLVLPMGLNGLVRMLPKNIIVVAGCKNAGKSALLFNIAHDNRDKHVIRYMNSEAGEQELAERIERFGEPLDTWDSVEFIDRSADFADAIIPDGLNIIDYMELDPERTYMVTQYMREIHDKLTTGVAVVALQKKIGAMVGVGGEGSLEKARLYLNLEGNKISVVKAKNWRHSYQNPNGMEREFSLYNGCKFTPQAEWHLAEDRQAPKGFR